MASRAKLMFAALLLPFGFTLATSGQRFVIPPEWHQPLNQQELAFADRVTVALKRSADFPKIAKYRIGPGAPRAKQINAWERNMEIWVPVEMFRFVASDPTMLGFLLAHEAGHAKQEEIYGRSCNAAATLQASTFDWRGALGDIVGEAATGGADGASGAGAVIQQQVCEDNADAWAVKFMREAGLDAAGGIRLITKFSQWNGDAGWRSLTQQFTSDHFINELRIAHLTKLILRGK